MNLLIATACIVSVCWLNPPPVRGAFLARHIGATDPTLEGLTALVGGDPRYGPVIGDLSSNSWSIQSGTGADIASYRKQFTLDEVRNLSLGWTLSLRLRVLEPVGSAFGNFVSFATSEEYFFFRLGNQNDGDPIVRTGNQEFVFEGAGSGYHDFQIKYDAYTRLAELWFDGARFAAGLAGSSYASRAQLTWGIGQHPPGSAASNWSEVTLSVVPEPSCAALLCLGGALL